LHLLLSGLILQSDQDASLRIPFRIRMRRRGSPDWRYLPEIHYMDNTQSQRRLQIKFLFGEAFSGTLPNPPQSRGWVEARKRVPAQDVLPVGEDWNADSYFSAGSGNDVYAYSLNETTNVRNISLQADIVTVYLDSAEWEPGIYDIEIKRGATFKNADFTSSTYVYNGNVLDFFTSQASGNLPMTRAGLLDKMSIQRLVNIRNLPPINQKNLALIYLTARNRSVDNLSVKASAYVRDYQVTDLPWTNGTPAEANNWRRVCWSPELGLFVAVARTGTNRVMTSPDGENWTAQEAAAENEWYDICWSSELSLFVACAHTGSATTTRVMTSPDGENWTARTFNASGVAVCWSPERQLFVIVGVNTIYTSPDGVNWTSRTSPENANRQSVIWVKELGLFVATATNGSIITSPNGVTWTVRRSAADPALADVAWSPERRILVAVGRSGDDRVLTSTDGVQWTARTAAEDNSWYGLAWSAQFGLFVAVASDGTNRVMTSPDGIEWTARAASSAEAWINLTWSPELERFAAVANGAAMASGEPTRAWGGSVITSNPAAHVLDALTNSAMNFDPLPEEVVDFDSINEFYEVCARNNYTVDMVCEGTPIADALRIMTSCGFARMYQSEVWGVIRDYDRTDETPVQVFSPRNSTDFAWRKAFPRMPAGLRVNYSDVTNEYARRQVTVYRNGASESDARLEQATYEGLVELEKVIERAEFDIRQAQHRSVIYTLSVPAEALRCRRGSLVGYEDEILTVWSGSGRIDSVQIDDDTGKITGVTLDTVVPVKNELGIHEITSVKSVSSWRSIGLKSGVLIRQTDGEKTVHALNNASGETNVLTFSTPVDVETTPGSSFDADDSINKIGQDCFVIVGLRGKEVKRLVVTEIQPGRDLGAVLTMVDDASEKIWA
jgi:hypothetical protein